MKVFSGIKCSLQGAPNDGFLLNTLKTLLGYPECFLIFRKTFYIYSVILGVLESLRHYKGLCIIVPKILDAI